MNAGVALAGFGIGIVVGLCGMGAGSLLTPLLVVVFGVNTMAAIASDLAASAVTKLAGAFMQYKQRTLDTRLVLLLCGGGMPGALVGLVLLHRIEQLFGQLWLDALASRVLGAALVLSALALLLGMNAGECAAEGAAVLTRRQLASVPLVGFIVGLLVSMTSVGSGSLTLPLLLIILPQIGIRRLIGCDIAFGAIVLTLAAAGQWRLGFTDPPIVMSLLAGSIPGVLIGSKLCALVPARYFRPVLIGAMAISGARLL